MTNQNVYIMSLEGSQVYSHVKRGTEINRNFNGMIPYSLELCKLQEQGLSTFHSNRHPNKTLSTDVINLKFKSKLRSGKELLKNNNEKLDSVKDEISSMKLDYKTNSYEWLKRDKVKFLNKYHDKLKYRRYLNKLVATIKSEIETEKWKEVKNDELREYLYKNGFTITSTDKDGKETKVSYKVYKRSSSKSRKGEVLFIKNELYKEMKSWSRMYLKFDNLENLKLEEQPDVASILAYESLVSSSITSKVVIKPENMLLVSDVESVFPYKANVIRKGENGILESVEDENATIRNSLFDGESLLEKDYFPEGKSMMLLRSHFFKSAAFSTNIQLFLEDNCPKDIPFNEWEIEDMFGQPVLAKNVNFIFTPNSLKALKLHNVDKDILTKQEMYNYWKKLNEDGVFGVCKTEKKSGRGYDDNGNILNQTSYQIINSMPLSQEDITNLSDFEKKYIERLKNDIGSFIEYLKQDANDVNANQMFIDLYNHNEDIIATKVFKEFRREKVKSHIKHIKKGKVRITGDYNIMFGNGYEFLLHSIGKFDVNKTKLTLNENEVYTTLFSKGEYAVFRNPHTSPNNVYYVKVVGENELIETYFNLSKNIICINGVKNPACDRLSGADFDSDSCLVTDSSIIKSAAFDCYKDFNVCINEIEASSKRYDLSDEDMAKIDNQLSTSQKVIGKTVNLAQNFMSVYWDRVNNGKGDTEKLSRNIEILTILSGVCIDLAKKFYTIDINEQLDHIRSQLEFNKVTVKGKDVKVKPNFWLGVKKSKKSSDKKKSNSKSKEKSKKNHHYDTPMDYLHREFKTINEADTIGTILMESLLNDLNHNLANRKLKESIITSVKTMQMDIEELFRYFNSDDEDERNERHNAHEDAYNECVQRIAKRKIKPETMYDILRRIELSEDDNGYSYMGVRLMNTLYKAHPETFFNVFSQKKSQK